MGSCFSSSSAQETTTTTNGGTTTSPPTTTTTTTTTTNNLYYNKLPPNATKHSVHHVYDGDTLTLTDRRRVRFLGIDTPELAEKQPFAEEAKQYTLSRCDETDIYLSFEPDGDCEDKYGRLLAWVWITVGGSSSSSSTSGTTSYECVNEGLVAAGYAGVYKAKKTDKLFNYDKLLSLQKHARETRRGMWGEDFFRDYEVVATTNGAAFHKSDCRHVEGRRVDEMMASEAMDRGLHACRTCLAD